MRRLRVEVAGLFGDEARAERLERALRRLTGVRAVRASARSGRVLVVAEGCEPGSLEAAIAAEADPVGPEAPSLRRLAARAVEAARALGAGIHAARGGAEEPVAELDRDHWHARSAAEIAAELGVDPRLGLDEAEAARRARGHGRNVLAGIEPRSAAAIVAGQALTVPTAILGVAAGTSLLLGDMLEALAIAAVVGSNVAIGYFTERRAEELLHAFGELRAGRARARRRGREIGVDAADLVPGDVLVLRAGEPVTADARVLASSALTADESTLTGESEPSEKSVDPVPSSAPVADRSSMVFAGTVIASGEGEAVVTATGERTELGAVRRALATASDRAAPLERQLDALGKRLSILAAAAAGGMIPIGLVRGRRLRDLARGAVALGVAAIPEGIPTAGTTALALTSKKLLRRGIVIRRLAAAETLGAVSAVCADKTGTLTWNRMRVEELFVPGEGAIEARWDEARLALRRADDGDIEARAIADLARVLALNADVEVDEGGAVKRGSGTERALVELAFAAGFPVVRARARSRRVGEERRSTARSFMVTVHDDPELGRIELVKGAPEQVLDLCEAWPDASPDLRRINDAMAERGLRVLACASRRLPAADGARFTFLGLVGLRDPPRDGVREAIAALARAGVRTYMLTGDQERTAKAVAASLGIDPDAVYARVTPEAKVEVVRDLQARGHVVAMTGDGVNDGPALKAADVGVAMGQRGTDVARAVADVVLARDDLPAIAEAVAEGRRLYDNVRRAIDYFVATNTSEVMVMLLGAVARESPLSPLQLLWLNMLTDVVPALALAVEPAERGIMERPPRDPEAPLLGDRSWRTLGRPALEMAAASLGAFALGSVARPSRGAPPALAFTALVTAQLLRTRAHRARGSGHHEALGRALAGSFALQIGALMSPPVRRALGVSGTPAPWLAIAAGIGALPALAHRARSRARDGVTGVDEIVIETAIARPAGRTKSTAPRADHEVEQGQSQPQPQEGMR